MPDISRRFHGLRIPLLLLAFSAAGPLLSCGDENQPVVPDAEPVNREPIPQKAWTFLLYDDADFSNAYDPLNDFATRVASGPQVNFLVLRDSGDGPAAIYSVGPSHEILLEEFLGEVNMGAAPTLSENLSWVKTYFPAERYIVAFYDHGGGWRGSCWDMTSENDNLTMGETKAALAQAGGVDLVLFTAPCLMGAFEAAYNLREVTEVYMGSEATSGFILWTEPLGELPQKLEADPDISSSDLAAFLIETIWAIPNMNQEEWIGYLTMSAVRSSGLDALGEALDALSLAYLEESDSFRAHLDSTRDELIPFGTGIVDLQKLMEVLLDVEEDEALRTSLEAVQAALAEAVIAEVHGSEWPQARGLSLFLPDSTSAGLLRSYTSSTYDLEFVSDTHWDELLQAAFPGWASLASPPEDGLSPGLLSPSLYSATGEEPGRGLLSSCMGYSRSSTSP